MLYRYKWFWGVFIWILYKHWSFKKYKYICDFGFVLFGIFWLFVFCFGFFCVCDFVVLFFFFNLKFSAYFRIIVTERSSNQA